MEHAAHAEQAAQPALPQIIYEDHHLIGLNKGCGDLVEWDKSGDEPLLARVQRGLADRNPAERGHGGDRELPFVGVIHRLDRPTSGCVVYARTAAAQRQMNALFRDGSVAKTYWAVVHAPPPEPEGVLEHFIFHDKELNKSFTSEEPREKAKHAKLAYRLLGASKRYYFLEIDLLTGRHHQIRAQLAAVGCHIKGDLKYGAPRSNPAGGIHLHSRELSFRHPIREHPVFICADPPDETVWNVLLESGQWKKWQCRSR